MIINKFIYKDKNPGFSGFFIFCLLFFTFNTSCFWTSQRLGNKIVVQVNEQKLDLKTFSESLARQLKNFDSLTAKEPENLRRLKNDIVRRFILESLIGDFAKVEKIVVSDKELNEEVNKIRSSYPDDVSFRRILAQENLSFNQWQDNLKKSMLEKKVFKVLTSNQAEPNETEIKKYYEDNKKKFKTNEKIYLRQIIVDELSKAESIKLELKNKDFIQVANKASVSPEGKNGGLVGWIEKGTVDIFDKAFDLKIGQVSQVLESSYGFHIFKVERKAPAGFSTLEEVKNIIKHQLSANKEQAIFSAWLDKQIRASRVLKDTALIDSVNVETKGIKK